MKTTNLKGTYAAIDLDCIVHNFKEACRVVGDDVLVSCVVKADAYGHGESQVVQALMDSGLNMFCVSTIAEALRLRLAFKDIDILILGYTPRHLLHKISENNLMQAISTLEEAELLNALGKARVHIKVNTGMNRLGFSWEDDAAIEQVAKMANLQIAGIFSHLHSSDSHDKTSAKKQFRRFQGLLRRLEDRKVDVGTRHICNSAGIIDCKDFGLDMVREGIMLYGLYPSDEVNLEGADLREAMSYRSYIAALHEVAKGDGISYGHTYFADRDMTVATINMGYSDGLFRHLSNKGEAIIRDQRCRIIGRVCMNMFMVDVTDLDEVAVEDEVIIFGRDKREMIPIDEVAKHVGTINYEVVCRVGYSVPRVFIRNGQILEIESGLLVDSSGTPSHSEEHTAICR